ncbi:hypothetical protein CEP53_013108 [Fusarium sp. AF-6]|nr:hypothetical protein CEP53_013108 [Fusarium sp. AF-6]
MSEKAEFLRYASPNEMRTIVREDLGFYHAVIIGAVYEFEDGFDVKSPTSYFAPLKNCIDQHPFFSVTVGDRHTEKAFYQRVSSINLEDHITIVDDSNVSVDPLGAIGKVLVPELDLPFTAGNPPWRIVVLPLKPSECFVAFSFSHMIGDGPTGIAFHKSFLAGCRGTPVVEPTAIVTPPATPLTEPFDTPERLPISWKFLLEPLIALFMPNFLVKLLGMRLGASTVNEGTFTGGIMTYNPEKYYTKLRIGEIKAPLVGNAIKAARAHDAKLTGTMQALIARAMSKTVPDAKFTNLVSETPANMRRSVGASNDVDGQFVSAGYIPFPRSDATGPLTDKEWESASASTRELAATAVRLHDQPVGLLRYAPSIRKWTLSKVGKSRDSSFGISNVGAFDTDGIAEKETARITKMVFAQPGSVASSPITFNVIAVKGGDLVYTVTWLPGSLGLGLSEEQEDKVVDEICASVDQGFKDLA